MIVFPFHKIQIVTIFFIYLFIPLPTLEAFEFSDSLIIDRLVKSCYSNTKSCNAALLKIHNLQKNAAINRNFSCQTRLLGLEANLIMAMNSNLKRKDAKSIIEAVKNYC